MDRTIAPPVRTVTGIDLITPQHTRLSNGIPVAILPAGSEPVCRIDIVFDAGSRYQDRIFQASLANQMIPEGTGALTGGRIAEEFEYYGSFFNVSSDRDEAEITIHTLDKHLEPLLRMMGEVIVRPSFPAEELEIIKDNRIESMKVDEQRVESLARKDFNRMIFGPGHPYGVIGEIPDIGPVNRDMLIDFHRRFYRPARCRILITGPHPDRYLPLVERFFGEGWPLEKPFETFLPEPLPPLQTQADAIRTINRPEAVQTAVRIGKPLFNRQHPDYMGLAIVNTILGGYFGSRLMSNIREEKGYTYGIGSHLVMLRNSGYFVIGTNVAAGVWKETIAECRKEIDRLCNDRIPGEELTLVRNYLTGSIQRSLDGPFQLADQFRALWIHDRDLGFFTDMLKLINSITPEEIRDLAIRHLGSDGMKVVAAGPVES
jgi:zinc protease